MSITTRKRTTVGAQSFDIFEQPITDGQTIRWSWNLQSKSRAVPAGHPLEVAHAAGLSSFVRDGLDVNRTGPEQSGEPFYNEGTWDEQGAVIVSSKPSLVFRITGIAGRTIEWTLQLDTGSN